MINKNTCSMNSLLINTLPFNCLLPKATAVWLVSWYWLLLEHHPRHISFRHCIDSACSFHSSICLIEKFYLSYLILTSSLFCFLSINFSSLMGFCIVMEWSENGFIRQSRPNWKVLISTRLQWYPVAFHSEIDISWNMNWVNATLHAYSESRNLVLD